MSTPAVKVNTPVSDLHEVARNYAKAGIPIFPCTPGTKIPLAGTNGFHDATTDLQQIDEWWREHPDANIGMYLHGAGSCAVDIDGSKGKASWLHFELDHDIPETREIRTPSGGRHLIFKGTLPSTAGKLAPGIDTRGEGGYVVAPPSWVEATEGKPAGSYSLHHDREPAPLPGWLGQALAARAEPRKALAGVILDQPRNVWRASEHLKARVRRGVVAMEGQGGDLHTYQVACKLSDMGLSEDAAFEKMRDEWNAHCQPPWDEDALRTKVQNACRYGQNEPGCDAVPSGIEVFGNLPSVKKLLAESAAAEEVQIRDCLSRLGGPNANEVQPEIMNWLWRNRIPRGMLSLLAGDGDMGKSTILCDIIARVTKGAAWPDAVGRAPKGRVLLFNREDHISKTLIGRLQAAGADRALVKIVTHINGDDGAAEPFHLNREDHRAFLKRSVQAYGDVQLIIFDPISSYFGDGVNAWKESEVRAVLEPLAKTAETLDIAVIGNAHLAKGNRTTSNANMQILNSVAVSSVARVINQVDESDDDPDIRMFGQTKRNVAKGVPTLRYAIEGIDLASGAVLGEDQEGGSRLQGTRVKWLGPAERSIRDLRVGRTGRGGRKASEREDAVRFLREVLEDGPQPAGKVMQAATAEGFRERTLERARRELGIKPIEKQFQGATLLALPDWERGRMPAIVGQEDEDW